MLLDRIYSRNVTYGVSVEINFVVCTQYSVYTGTVSGPVPSHGMDLGAGDRLVGPKPDARIPDDTGCSGCQKC